MLKILRNHAWVLALTACRLSTAGEEVLLPLGGSTSEVAMDSPHADAGQNSTATGSSPPAASTSTDDASADASHDAGAPPPPAADAGSVTSTPNNANHPDTDAGAPPAVVDDAQRAAQDVACAFEFATCLLLDPLNYAQCARMNADHCDLLSAPGMPGSAADGGTAPSTACALQTADCIARTPDKALDCIAMQDKCTL